MIWDLIMVIVIASSVITQVKVNKYIKEQKLKERDSKIERK